MNITIQKLVALLTVMCLFYLPAMPQVLDFKYNRTFGTPVIYPDDIAVDKDNNIYVLEEKSINKFDADGKLLLSIPLQFKHVGFSSAGIALDKNSNIYIVHTSHHIIQKFNSAGNLIGQFGSSGTTAGKFTYPQDIAVDNAGNIYIADSGNNRIQKLTSDGNFIYEYKTPPSTITEFNSPVAVEVGTSGDIYFLTESNKIYKLKPDGTLRESFNVSIQHSIPSRNKNTLALDAAENIYVSDLSKKNIHKLTKSGEYLQSFGNDNGTAIFHGDKIGLTVAQNGNLYAIDRSYYLASRSIYIFNNTGELLKKLGNNEAYTDITFDNKGNYYVITGRTGLFSPGKFIQKFNTHGVLINQFGTLGTGDGQFNYPRAITVDVKGHLYCLESISNWVRIQKFTSDGKLLKSFKDFAKNLHDKTFSDIAVDQSGNIFLTNNFGGNILKLDSEGNIIKSLITSGSSDGYLWLPQALAIAPNGDLYVMDQGTRIQKFNKEGLFLKKVSPVVQYTNNSMAAHMSIDRLGNLYAYNSQNNFINVFDKNDEEVKRIDGVNGPFTIDIAVSKLLISQDTYVEEYISDQSLYKAFITGKIYQDKNSNCSFDSNESFLTDIVLKAEPGPFYGFADDSGNYTIPVEAGSYTVSPLLPQERGRDILATCPVSSPPVILVSTIDSKVVGPDFGLEVTLSPHLNVNLSSNRRRRCFENVTTVSYSNTGFAPAANAKVTVQFPAEVIFKSASMPFTRDSKGNYVFAVGDLQPNQHGIITIKDSVSCADPNIRGLTVCTRAWITPTNTYPTPPTYNRADMAVEASATNEEQARFVLKNKGQGAMTDSLTYRVYQDLELSLTGKYKLAAGDSLVLKFPTESRVLRVEADQPQEHPIKTIASADLEMKKANTTGLPDVAMMAMPKDDPEPEITEECLPIIDSFDPNDKQVVPVGLTSEKYTPTNTLLRYTVRFQNTGTDVAYRVVVVDTLSAELDMSTFAVGAVSHPYKLAVSGKERPVLTFTFDNIMLPDSGTNQAGSNGAIQFSIKPKAGLAEKHLIENFADIFFDYNEPVRTNTTQNRIYDMPPVVSTKPLSAQQVEVSPVITSFSPAQSRLGGIVTLTGKNFTAASAGNKVTFNGVMAQILSASVSELKVTVPNNSYTGKIKVVTPDGASSSATEFVVFQPPTISAVSLAEAVPGTVVTITGNHFSPITTQDTITFGDVAARVLSATTSQLQVEVPTGATLGKIVLKTLGGMVESQQAFKVWYLPTITNFTPAKGKAGTLLTLNGTNFAEVANRNVVKIGTVPLDVLQATQEKLEIRVPATAVTGKLSVQTPGGTAATATDFVFVPAPVITSFNPPSGNAGTTVTITGKNFNADGAADVITFNGKEAPVVRATETELVVKAPKGVTTGALVVTGAGGQATGQDFVVNYLSTDEAISVYPNPTAGEVVVNWFKANYQVQSISVYDAVGKEVIKHIIGNLPNDEVRLSIAHYGKGVYLVRIKTSEGVVMKRITVL